MVEGYGSGRRHVQGLDAGLERDKKPDCHLPEQGGGKTSSFIPKGKGQSSRSARDIGEGHRASLMGVCRIEHRGVV